MKRTNKAFTLVEMLIVVVIIGILAAALIPRLIGAQAQARDTARVAGVGQIKNGLEVYYSDQGTYPSTTTYSTDALSGSLTGQLSDIPRDPQATKTSKIMDKTSKPGYWAYTNLTGTNGTPAYGVFAAMETEKRSNYIYGGTTLGSANGDFEKIKGVIGNCSGKVTIGTTDPINCKGANGDIQFAQVASQ